MHTAGAEGMHLQPTNTKTYNQKEKQQFNSLLGCLSTKKVPTGDWHHRFLPETQQPRLNVQSVAHPFYWLAYSQGVA